MPGERFTAWLSEDEHAALRKMSDEQDRSKNFIVRTALRALLFDTPIPAHMKPKGKHESDTVTTR